MQQEEPNKYVKELTQEKYNMASLRRYIQIS